MARARNIKPGFFSNDQLAELPPLTRLLFAGLWTIADRAGRLEDRPKKIKAEILPYDNANADKMLDELASRNFVIRYEVKGVKYLQVVSFAKHQNPHKNEAESTIPAPDEHSTSTVQSTTKNGTNRADSLFIDSLNPISPQAPGFALPAWVDAAVWRDFEESRKKLRKPMTERARREILAELEKLSPDHAQVADILAQSIRNSWQDVFPLRDKSGKANGAPGHDWRATNESIFAKAKELNIDIGGLSTQQACAKIQQRIAQ